MGETDELQRQLSALFHGMLAAAPDDWRSGSLTAVADGSRLACEFMSEEAGVRLPVGPNLALAIIGFYTSSARLGQRWAEMRLSYRWETDGALFDYDFAPVAAELRREPVKVTSLTSTGSMIMPWPPATSPAPAAAASAVANEPARDLQVQRAKWAIWLAGGIPLLPAAAMVIPGVLPGGTEGAVVPAALLAGPALLLLITRRPWAAGLLTGVLGLLGLPLVAAGISAASENPAAISLIVGVAILLVLGVRAFYAARRLRELTSPPKGVVA